MNVIGVNVHIKNHNYEFLDLFKPIENIKFINESEFNKKFKSNQYKIYNKHGSDRDRKEIVYNSSNDSAIFYKIIHLIHYKDDNIIGKFIPYPREKVFENNFINEFRLILKDFKPIDKILEKVNTVTKLFKNLFSSNQLEINHLYYDLLVLVQTKPKDNILFYLYYY